jgi:hypothetical protein
MGDSSPFYKGGFMAHANAVSYPIHAPVSHPLRRDLTAAVITGQVAGLIMAIVIMAVFALFLGKSPLYPVQVIGAFVFGDKALQGFQIGALLMGLVLHQLGPALFWSLVFGLGIHLFHIRSGTALLLLGIIIGLVSQVVDVNLILPVAMQSLQGHNIWAEQVPNFWSWAAHVVYGLSLALFVKVDSWLGHPAVEGQ